MSGGGVVRLSSTTVAETVARAIHEIQEIRGDFERLLRGVELTRGSTPLPRGEKIPLDVQDLVVRVKVTLSPQVPSFLEVARRVQENIFRTLRLRLGILPLRVDVEVENVEWSELDERG